MNLNHGDSAAMRSRLYLRRSAQFPLETSISAELYTLLTGQVIGIHGELKVSRDGSLHRSLARSGFH
jgi:hypothetical protein